MIDREEHPLAPMVRKLEYWGKLGTQDRAAILALPHRLKSVERSHYIVRERESTETTCLLRSGFAYRQKIVANGARQILAIQMRGDLVDLQNSLLEVADHSIQALTDAEVALIPREAIQDLAFARPSVGKALWRDTLVEASIAREWQANVGRRDSRTRVAHLLCEFAIRLQAAKLGEQQQWELPMTQEQLADCTGLTPVHINRTIRALERDQCISRSKRAVRIPDWRRLARIGDFDMTFLHLSEKTVRGKNSTD